MKMYIFGLMFFILVACGQYFLLGQFSVSGDLITNIVTFLSVIFGFYITSLAIFATSQYVANLYKITDKNNKTVTLLHTLIKNYRNGLVVILFSILYFLILNFFLSQHIEKTILLKDYKTWPFIAVVLFNFWYSYKMLSDLINVILQEGKYRASL